MNFEKSLWDEFIDFRKNCKKTNDAFPESAFISHLLIELPNYVKNIEAGSVFFRARVFQNSFPDLFFDYAKNILSDAENREQLLMKLSDAINAQKVQKEMGFKGYNAVESFINPNPETISSGRCNQKNEQCLYLAEDPKTAISELKPLIQEKISVASIQAKEELKVIDFGLDSANNPLQRLIAFLFVSSPTKEDSDAYIYTQIICSIIKKEGYDGIRYSSCQNLIKTNYVVFNFNKCVPLSSEVYMVKHINYQIEKE